MSDKLLREIKDKLEEIDEKIFIGFFDLSYEELEMIDKDVEAYEKGNLELIDLETAKRLLNDDNPKFSRKQTSSTHPKSHQP